MINNFSHQFGPSLLRFIKKKIISSFLFALKESSTKIVSNSRRGLSSSLFSNTFSLSLIPFPRHIFFEANIIFRLFKHRKENRLFDLKQNSYFITTSPILNKNVEIFKVKRL